MLFKIICIFGIPIGVLLVNPQSPEIALLSAVVLFVMAVYSPAQMFVLYFTVFTAPLYFLSFEDPMVVFSWFYCLVFLFYRLWLKLSDKDQPVYRLKESLGWFGWGIQAWGVSIVIPSTYDQIYHSEYYLILFISIPAAFAATYYFLNEIDKYISAKNPKHERFGNEHDMSCEETEEKYRQWLQDNHADNQANWNYYEHMYRMEFRKWVNHKYRVATDQNDE